MARRRKSTRGKRGVSRTGPSLTPSQKFEAELSARKDRAVLKGSFLNSSSTVAINSLAMNPTILGQRPSAMSAIFSRFRILRLVIKILPPVVSSLVAPTPFALGVLDDDYSNSGEDPVSINGIAALRCSTVYGAGMTLPTEIQWSPIDPNRWFYVFTESVNPDQRLTIPCTLIFNVSTGSLVTFQVYYTLEFEGATSNS